MNNYHSLSSEEILRAACPVCKAPAGGMCIEPTTKEPRERHHLDRVTVARMVGSQQRPVQRELDAKRRRVADRWLRP